MGMAFADWVPAPAKFWLLAVALGVAAGSAGLVWAYLAQSRINVAENWGVFLLQVALGPVLEEFLFRGYLIRLLLSVVKVWRHETVVGSAAVVLISAVAFGAIHLLRTGTTWKEVAVISGLGAIYGSIRTASGSSAAAAVAHGFYNLTLYIFILGRPSHADRAGRPWNSPLTEPRVRGNCRCQRDPDCDFQVGDGS